MIINTKIKKYSFYFLTDLRKMLLSHLVQIEELVHSKQLVLLTLHSIHFKLEAVEILVYVFVSTEQLEMQFD